VAVAAVFAVAGTDECGAVLTKADGSSWTCTFVEDFGGKSLDTRKWVVQDTSSSGFTMGRTCFDSEGVKLRRGELHLTVKKVKPFTCRSPFGNFTSEHKGGDISTWGRFSQTYGRWPNSGEIDVAEWWSSRHEYVHPSLHYAGRDFWEEPVGTATSVPPTPSARMRWSGAPR
jgi:hypothetical protein